MTPEQMEALKGVLTEVVEPLKKSRDEQQAALEELQKRFDAQAEITKAIAEEMAKFEENGGVAKSVEDLQTALSQALDEIATLRKHTGAGGVRKSAPAEDGTTDVAKSSEADDSNDALAKAIRRALPQMFGGEGARVNIGVSSE